MMPIDGRELSCLERSCSAGFRQIPNASHHGLHSFSPRQMPLFDYEATPRLADDEFLEFIAQLCSVQYAAPAPSAFLLHGKPSLLGFLAFITTTGFLAPPSLPRLEITGIPTAVQLERWHTYLRIVHRPSAYEFLDFASYSASAVCSHVTSFRAQSTSGAIFASRHAQAVAAARARAARTFYRFRISAAHQPSTMMHYAIIFFL